MSKLEKTIWHLWITGNSVATIALHTNKTIMQVLSIMEELASNQTRGDS